MPYLSKDDKSGCHRRRYLPGQLEAARRKVVMLEREAARYGMVELLTPSNEERAN